MPTLIVACQTLAEELDLASRQLECQLPVRWIESGLHNDPSRLRQRIQQTLDEIVDADRVLLAFGFCGNSVLGLTAGAFELVFPRADDCISLMLGSCDRRKEVSSEKSTYFLTRGYLEHESNIWAEYQAMVARRGREKADRLYATLLKHYRRLGIIDTGAYPLESFLERTRPIADVLHLDHEVIPGTTRYLRKLLTGPWDEEFVTIAPHTTVTFDDLFGGTDQRAPA